MDREQGREVVKALSAGLVLGVLVVLVVLARVAPERLMPPVAIEPPPLEAGDDSAEPQGGVPGAASAAAPSAAVGEPDERTEQPPLGDHTDGGGPPHSDSDPSARGSEAPPPTPGPDPAPEADPSPDPTAQEGGVEDGQTSPPPQDAPAPRYGPANLGYFVDAVERVAFSDGDGYMTTATITLVPDAPLTVWPQMWALDGGLASQIEIRNPSDPTSFQIVLDRVTLPANEATVLTVQRYHKVVDGGAIDVAMNRPAEGEWSSLSRFNAFDAP